MYLLEMTWSHSLEGRVEEELSFQQCSILVWLLSLRLENSPHSQFYATHRYASLRPSKLKQLNDVVVTSKNHPEERRKLTKYFFEDQEGFRGYPMWLFIAIYQSIGSDGMVLDWTTGNSTRFPLQMSWRQFIRSPAAVDELISLIRIDNNFTIN